jgi:DNA-binding MarR family transcriptional regulator
VARLTDRHFAGLLGVRTAIANYEQISEREARVLGATHAQHHVLLGLYGSKEAAAPTVKDIAHILGVASPSAVGLITRMVDAGLLERNVDQTDRRVTRLRLTKPGERVLRQLSDTHFSRLRDLTTQGVELLRD